MTDLNATIAGYVVGDNLEVRRQVIDLPVFMTRAWFTVKASPDDLDSAALVQKVITEEDQVGVGEIELPGDSSGVGSIRFDLLSEDTEAIGTVARSYDIQVMLDGGNIYTIEKGRILLTGQITDSIV
jgi:hypothetical protein